MCAPEGEKGARIDQRGSTCEHLLTAGIEEEILAFDPQQWELIATQLAGGRSAADCMTRWCNHLRPSVKHCKDGLDVHWTPEEDERLAELARELSEHNVRAVLVQRLPSTGKG